MAEIAFVWIKFYMSCIINLFHVLNCHVPIFSKDLCLFNQAHVETLKRHNKNEEYFFEKCFHTAGVFSMRCFRFVLQNLLQSVHKKYTISNNNKYRLSNNFPGIHPQDSRDIVSFYLIHTTSSYPPTEVITRLDGYIAV